MTKAQEIELLASWISAAPADSYLAGMLRNIQMQFENDTRSDFPCLPNLHEIERQAREQQARLKEIQTTTDLEGKHVLELERKARAAKDALAEIRRQALQIGNAR